MRVVRAAAGIAAPKATTGQPASAQAKLAELLISEKALTSRQIQDLDKSRDGKQTLSNAILRSGLVAPETLASALARVSGHPVTSLRVAPEAAVVRQLPRRFCELNAVSLIEFGRASATLATLRALPHDEPAMRFAFVVANPDREVPVELRLKVEEVRGEAALGLAERELAISSSSGRGRNERSHTETTTVRSKTGTSQIRRVSPHAT